MTSTTPVTEQEQPKQFRALTPSGIEIAYEPEPKRRYLIRQTEGGMEGLFHEEGWAEVPSVTTALEVLEKGGLSWWGMGVGVDGVLSLIREGVMRQEGGFLCRLADWPWTPVDSEGVVELLKAHKLTVNDVKGKAGDRGVAVHDALETWAKTGDKPDPSIFPDEQRGYVVGLLAFLNDVESAEPEACEVMVGSVRHGFAGRYDIRFKTTKEHPVVVHRTPVKGPQYALLKPGMYLGDLKTSRGIYHSHHLQLAAYEGASQECGFDPTDAQGILNVSHDGTYQFKRSVATLDDFLAVKATYEVVARVKGAMKRS
jgi:hypothetical protein